MNKQIHYGTVTHWFTDLQRGSVLSDNHGTQRILLEAHSLTEGYRTPQSGDRISFGLHEDGKGRLCAEEAALLPPLAENERVEIVLSDWNYQQNGGYGIHHVQRNSPIFILGQFLNDQTRIPESGETLEGRLVRHSNDQWLLVEVDIIETAASEQPALPVPEDIPVPPPPPPPRRTKNTAQPLQNTELPAALPANRVLGGTVVRWDDPKGYGFITAENQQSVFFHISAFHYMSQRPQTGQKVSFYCNRPVGSEPQRAIRVVLSGHEASLFSERPYDYHKFNLNMRKLLCYGLTGGLYLCGVAYCSLKLAAFYFLASIAAFCLYCSDKQTAVTQSHKKQGYLGRVPEKKLHQIGLIGGWPGALLARGAYNHKTGKARFIRIFWLTVAANVAITYALLLHYGNNPIALFLKN